MPLITVPSAVKRATSGYITDDHFLYLLVLKKWFYNVYPPDSSKISLVDSATNMWDTHGLCSHEFLSSPLIPPHNNPNWERLGNRYVAGVVRMDTNECVLVGSSTCNRKPEMVDGIVGHLRLSGGTNSSNNSSMVDRTAWCACPAVTRYLEILRNAV
jgi:hypothetical protein